MREALNQDLIPNSRRAPRIPTDDRYWLSFGAGYLPCANLAVDFGYTHVFMKDASIDLPASRPGNQFRGTFAAHVEGKSTFWLQARWVF